MDKLKDSLLKNYTTVKEYSLKEANILHLYQGEKCKKLFRKADGFINNRHFILWGFNQTTKEKCYLGKHDRLDFFKLKEGVQAIEFFRDGATLIKFNNNVQVYSVTQTAHVYSKKGVIYD